MSDRLGVGSAALHLKEAWQVIAVRSGTRTLLSLDGKRVACVAVDRLQPAP